MSILILFYLRHNSFPRDSEWWLQTLTLSRTLDTKFETHLGNTALADQKSHSESSH